MLKQYYLYHSVVVLTCLAHHVLSNAVSGLCAPLSLPLPSLVNPLFVGLKYMLLSDKAVAVLLKSSCGFRTPFLPCLLPQFQQTQGQGDEA